MAPSMQIKAGFRSPLTVSFSLPTPQPEPESLTIAAAAAEVIEALAGSCFPRRSKLPAPHPPLLKQAPLPGPGIYAGPRDSPLSTLIPLLGPDIEPMPSQTGTAPFFSDSWEPTDTARERVALRVEERLMRTHTAAEEAAARVRAAHPPRVAGGDAELMLKTAEREAAMVQAARSVLDGELASSVLLGGGEGHLPGGEFSEDVLTMRTTSTLASFPSLASSALSLGLLEGDSMVASVHEHQSLSQALSVQSGQSGQDQPSRASSMLLALSALGNDDAPAACPPSPIARSGSHARELAAGMQLLSADALEDSPRPSNRPSPTQKTSALTDMTRAMANPLPGGGGGGGADLRAHTMLLPSSWPMDGSASIPHGGNTWSSGKSSGKSSGNARAATGGVAAHAAAGVTPQGVSIEIGGAAMLATMLGSSSNGSQHHAEGQRAEGRHAEGQHVDGQRADSQHAGSQHADDQHAEGRRAEGRRAEGVAAARGSSTPLADDRRRRPSARTLDERLSMMTAAEFEDIKSRVPSKGHSSAATGPAFRSASAPAAQSSESSSEMVKALSQQPAVASTSPLTVAPSAATASARAVTAAVTEQSAYYEDGDGYGDAYGYGYEGESSFSRGRTERMEAEARAEARAEVGLGLLAKTAEEARAALASAVSAEEAALAGMVSAEFQVEEAVEAKLTNQRAIEELSRLEAKGTAILAEKQGLALMVIQNEQRVRDARNNIDVARKRRFGGGKERDHAEHDLSLQESKLVRAQANLDVSEAKWAALDADISCKLADVERRDEELNGLETARDQGLAAGISTLGQTPTGLARMLSSEVLSSLPLSRSPAPRPRPAVRSARGSAGEGGGTQGGGARGGRRGRSGREGAVEGDLPGGGHRLAHARLLHKHQRLWRHLYTTSQGPPG